MEARLLERVRKDYPEIRFRTGARFSFRSPRTIIVGPAEPDDSLLLLHEMGHALLKHRDFKTDAMRLKMEREAWGKARELALRYKVEFDDELVERELDTYRDWLDKRSRCPRCNLTRYQTPNGIYHCPRCEGII